MVVFNNTLDVATFNECLKYVQDTLNWLATEEENRRDTVSRFPPQLLDGTTRTLTTLLHHGAHHLQNTRVPINQLPPEILRRVLLYLQDTFPLIPDPLDGPLYSNSAAALWHRTSLVCRHWRWVVLNTPELWTTIKIRESEEPHFDDGTSDWPWFKVALLRSRTLPLTVRFETPLDSTLSDRADVHSILDEVHRIRELRIVTSDDVSYRWLRSFLEQSPQKLEVLIFDHGRDHIVSQRQNVSWTCELPRLLVLHAASSLAWQFWPASSTSCQLPSRRTALRRHRYSVVIRDPWDIGRFPVSDLAEADDITGQSCRR
ncbi:hypothetical protein BC629DRAFT_156975 [Irpex lacteus]|nr:hypothetical protein BC629DRAFT_156975 [Irpex lacteus]